MSPSLETSFRAYRAGGMSVAAMLLMVSAGGCVGNGNDGSSIPQSAEELGSGHVASAIAPRSGRVWIYDKEADRVLYRGRVDGGDAISVTATADRITVAGASVKLAAGEHLNRKHKYMIYFLK